MATPAPAKEYKKYTAAEISTHDGGVQLKALKAQYDAATDPEQKKKLQKQVEAAHTDTWIILHGLVFDVTKFKSKHPGGPQSFVETAGKDATQEFEELYHSATARDMLRDMVVGQLDTYDGDVERVFQFTSTDQASQNLGVVIAVGVAVAAALYYAFF